MACRQSVSDRSAMLKGVAVTRIIWSICCLALTLAMAHTVPLSQKQISSSRFEGWAVLSSECSDTAIRQVWRQRLYDLPKEVEGYTMVSYIVQQADTAKKAQQTAQELTKKQRFHDYIARGFALTVDKWSLSDAQQGVIATVRGIAHSSESADIAHRATIYTYVATVDKTVIWFELSQVLSANDLKLVDHAAEHASGKTLADDVANIVITLWENDAQPGDHYIPPPPTAPVDETTPPPPPTPPAKPTPPAQTAPAEPAKPAPPPPPPPPVPPAAKVTADPAKPAPQTPPAPASSETPVKVAPAAPTPPAPPAPPAANPPPDPAKTAPPARSDTPADTAKPAPPEPAKPTPPTTPAPPAPPAGKVWQTEDKTLTLSLPDAWSVAGKVPYIFTGEPDVTMRLYPADSYKTDDELKACIQEYIDSQREVSLSNKSFAQQACRLDGATGVVVRFTNYAGRITQGFFLGKSGRLWRIDIDLPGNNQALPESVQHVIEGMRVQ